jgi:hypothetical protein
MNTKIEKQLKRLERAIKKTPPDNPIAFAMTAQYRHLLEQIKN